MQSVRFVHISWTPPGTRMALGERVITRQAMFDAGRHPSGTLYTDCVAVGPTTSLFKATFQCTATFRFADGQVVIEGVNGIGGTEPVGIAVGAFADPGFPPPTASFFEARRHPWLAVPEATDRYETVPPRSPEPAGS